MTEQTLSLESRSQTGKNANRKLRASGKLPAILYGMGNNTMVTCDPRIVEKWLLTEGGRNQVFTLQGAGLEGKHALIKDYYVDPLSRRLKHVDFLAIDVTKKINVTVKLNFTGKAAGVAEGGVLNLLARQVEIRTLPNSIPGHIDVDVTALNIGDSIHLDDLKLPEGVEKSTAANPTLVACVPPAKEEDATASLAPSAEPEVITAKKEEPAEGAAAAAGGEKKDEKKK